MARSLYRSFAGGEITPELFGRIDLAKFQTGLGLCSNFRILPHGPATRRPGFEYATKAKSGVTRILPFVFSTTQSVVLEFGDQYIRFLIDGAPVLNTAQNITAISQAATGVLTYTGADYTNGQFVFLSGIGGMTALNGRYAVVTNVNAGANTFELFDLFGNPINTSALPAFTAGGTVASVYEIASPYLAADLFGLRYTQDADVFTITSIEYATRELRRLGATNWTLTEVDFSPSTTVPTGVGVVATVAVATNLSPQSYVVTTIDADGVTESLQSATVTASNNLSLAGNFNTISWGAVAGATRYNVYKLRGGTFGFIGSATGLSVVDDNVTADTTKTPPLDDTALNTGAGDYPTAVTYHEQRRWLGGTMNSPQRIIATRSGTESNLTTSLPAQDDDSLDFRVRARQQNAIMHLVPLSDLIALTTGAEFRIFSDGAPAITPTSLSVKPQGYTGASQVTPVVTSGSILYVQAQGSRVRELSYNWETQAYRSIDITLMAPHLVAGRTVVDMAYVRAPDQTLWAVRDDGTLLGMTYVPEQQVYGWHQHSTDGAFESVCTVPENGEDRLYAVIRREINGDTVRYIERMAQGFVPEIDDIADAMFLDSALTYSGAPITNIRGLHHLEGETVDVLADGTVEPSKTVVNGAITLIAPASKLSIGLGFSSRLRTLPLAMERMEAGGQGTRKNVAKVHLRVRSSNLLRVGPSFDKLTLAPSRDAGSNYNSAVDLRTGEVALVVAPSWSDDGAVCVEQSSPLPTTIVSMTLETEFGD